MKKFSFFSMLLLAAGLLLAGGALTSCGDGDDNKNNPEGGGGSNSGGGSVSQSAFSGNTWYTVYESDDLIEIEAYQFNSDGTGQGGELKRRASDNYTRTSGEQWDISYTVNGDVLTITEITPGEDYSVYSYKFKLNADGTMTWTRIKDGNLGKSYTYILLPPTQNPRASLEAILEGLVARRRN